MTNALLITVVAIEGAGLLITIGFGIAIFKAAREARKTANEAKKKAEGVVTATKRFLSDIETVLGN